MWGCRRVMSKGPWEASLRPDVMTGQGNEKETKLGQPPPSSEATSREWIGGVWTQRQPIPRYQRTPTFRESSCSIAFQASHIHRQVTVVTQVTVGSLLCV